MFPNISLKKRRLTAEVKHLIIIFLTGTSIGTIERLENGKMSLKYFLMNLNLKFD